ncbi:MAG: lamin tail domain-containing protein [Verrucomicrobiales bacterium]
MRATDPGGLWLENAFALAVVAPSAPSAIRLDADRIVRGTAPGTAIGHLTAEDPDLPDDAHAFAFAAGDGDADNAAFALAGNALVLAGPLPPGAAHASLRLRATDRSGLPVEQAIAIPIRDPGVRINEIVAANLAGLEDEDGDTPDWIELFNESGAPVDVGGWFLTDNPNNPTKWQIPAGTSLAAGGYLVVFASGKDRAEEGSEGHTNFSLSTEGEFLALIAADGATVADQIAPGYPAQSGGVSYGRTDTGSTLGFLSPPTPGAANGAAAYRFGANPVAFSHGRGFYQAAFALDLTAPVAGSEIRYTLDGSEPTPATGFRFTDPIAIAPPAGGTDSGVVTVRAVAFAADAPPGKAATHTYVFLDGATGGDSVADQSVLLPAIAAHPAYAPILGDAFKALPAVSITRPAGISLTEGEASVEFLPRGGAEPGFQIDGGIKIVGGASVGSPKNNFRLYFREEYGAARLDYDLFAGVPFAPPGADSFKRLNLRSGSHDTFYWLGNTANPPVANRHGDAQYLRNRWINDMQFAMGHEALRGRFAHVFLNGTYHGQYQFLEWPNDDYQAAYGGGEPGDYEYTSGASAAKSGSDHWQPTWAALKDAAATNYALAQRWIDLENLADYMLLNFYAGNTWDWNPNQNWMASGPNQPDRGGWKFFCWDADIILQDVANDATVKNVPDGLFSILMQNHEAFRVLFRDRIFRHCSEGGALTADRASAIYDTGRAQIFDSVVAETARWQPAGAASAPWDRDGEWEAEYQHYQTVWFPQRTAILLSQLRARGWYPNDPPAFSHPGGVSEGAISLTLANPNPGGTIFYTLDGSDPYSGGQSTRTESILVDQGDAARALIPSAANGGDLLGDSWKGGAAFDDSAWLAGTLGVGYETGGGAYPALTGLDVAAMQSAVGSAFIRVEFTAPPQAEIDAWDELALNVKYDDGFVAWLNGVEVARANAFAGPQPWNAIAEIQHDDAAAVAFERFDITAHRGLLNAGGPNVLAIQGLNVAVTSSDFLILPQLAGAVIEVGPENPARREYTGAIPVDSLATVKARVLDASGEWSPLAEAEFTVISGPPVAAAAGNIEISEIHYHPAEEGAPEFIELHAPGAAPVDLSGAALAGGIAFAFLEGTVIPAGGYLVAASNAEAFGARYRDPGSPYYGARTSGSPGEWQGALASGSEAVALLAAGGGEIVALTYDDGSRWPGRADGKGIFAGVENRRGRSLRTARRGARAASSAARRGARVPGQTRASRSMKSSPTPNRPPPMRSNFLTPLAARSTSRIGC